MEFKMTTASNDGIADRVHEQKEERQRGGSRKLTSGKLLGVVTANFELLAQVGRS